MSGYHLLFKLLFVWKQLSDKHTYYVTIYRIVVINLYTMRRLIR